MRLYLTWAVIIGRGRRPPRHGALRLAALLTLVLPLAAQAADDFFLFPAISVMHRSGVSPGQDLRRNDLNSGLDIFYTSDHDRLRLLGETFVSGQEQEIERLQIGWLLEPETTLWIGRYHNPLGYWNTQFHHGTYLQTSITRPGVMAFEDGGGPLVTHLVGPLLENARLNARNLFYTFGFGAAPALEERLEPVGLFKSRTDSHKPGETLKIFYRPDDETGNEAGMFISHVQIASTNPAVTEVRQNVGGFFSNWMWHAWRANNAIYFVENHLAMPSGELHSTFNNAYFQLEYAWHGSWAAYARAENTFGQNNDAYLTLFPDFVRKRALSGIRYDFVRHQALKLELSSNTLRQGKYNEIAIEWSAALP